jgi:hypothetical protein
MHQGFSSIDRHKDISLLTGLLRIDVSPTEKVRMIIISKGEGARYTLPSLQSFLESRSNFHDKKERFVVLNKTALLKCFPNCISTVWSLNLVHLNG